MPLRGDYTVELSARDLRTASIRFGMPTPVASARAAGFTLGWKRTDEAAALSIDKAGKPLSQTVNMPGFRVVGALKLTLEVRAGSITAKVADKPVFRLNRAVVPPDAASGYLVLDEFNAGARLSGVVIRTKFDRAWLDKNFVQPLRKQKIQEAAMGHGASTPRCSKARTRRRGACPRPTPGPSRQASRPRPNAPRAS